MKRNQKKILVLVGILVFSAAQITKNYFDLSDFAFGAFIGIGVGLMALSLFVRPKHRPVFRNNG